MSNGSLFIVSAPSGAGKTSLVKALLERCANLEVSVSHTTRAPRPGEQDGVHYHFVNVDAFQEMVQKEAFLEHAKVFDNFYGTAQSSVEARLTQGVDVLLEIDWQGARQVRAAMPQTVGVFILPPSRAALELRLRQRAQDSDAVIARRMRDAQAESAHYDEYDYLIINDNFDMALKELEAIILSRRLRRVVQATRYRDLIAELLA